MEVENLKAYLANINMTVKDFCEILECDNKHLSRIMNGKQSPGKRLAKDIRLATNGIIDLKVSPRKKEKKEQQQQKQEICCI